MTAQEIMTPNPKALEFDARISDAFELMYSLDIRHIPILKETELVGMLSDRDLQAFQIQVDETINLDEMEARRSAKLGDLVQGDVLYAYPETPLSELCDLIIEHKIGALPVVDPHEQSLVGIVSYIDVIKAARDML